MMVLCTECKGGRSAFMWLFLVASRVGGDAPRLKCQQGRVELPWPLALIPAVKNAKKFFYYLTGLLAACNFRGSTKFTERWFVTKPAETGSFRRFLLSRDAGPEVNAHEPFRV
jgi:hypothetical protein